MPCVAVAFMPLCTVALYGNILHFKRSLAFVENPQQTRGLEFFNLRTSASVLTRKAPRSLVLQWNSASCQFKPAGLSAATPVSVAPLRELEWKKFHQSTFPIHRSLFEPYLLTDLLSLGRSGPRHLPDAPIAASLQQCRYKGKSALYNRGHERCPAVTLIAAQSEHYMRDKWWQSNWWLEKKNKKRAETKFSHHSFR